MTEDSKTKPRIQLGYISLHREIPERIRFSDAYYAIRRHEMAERQLGIPDCLDEQAETESKETGCVVSYHVADGFEVFKIVTCPDRCETRIALPLDDPFDDRSVEEPDL